MHLADMYMYVHICPMSYLAWHCAFNYRNYGFIEENFMQANEK